ncbi:MAG: hypothetical protein KF799_07855 [Bdellovibrionales bacterium]|nr:hypothetical protein [Bdellovibrionales bacterium]
MRFFLLFFAFSAQADSIGKADLGIFPPAPSASAANDVEREFECIRLRTDNNHEMIKQPAALSMIKVLSQAMEDGFKEFNFSLFERAMFYSQAIEESGGFTQMTEAKQFVKAGADPIAHFIMADTNDKHFKAQKGAKVSSKFGSFRGRGIIQISRCDNYFSTIHYLNQMYSGQTPTWKAYWEYGPKGKRQQIEEVCNKADIKAMKDEYLVTQGMSANLYGILDDPSRLAVVKWEIQDPTTKRKIASEKLMVDATMAYWRGRCGQHVDASSDMALLAKFKPCEAYRSKKYLEWAVKCVTRCIKGTTDGWQKRLAWMEKALMCAR